LKSEIIPDLAQVMEEVKDKRARTGAFDWFISWVEG